MGNESQQTILETERADATMDNKQKHAVMRAAGLNPVVCGGVTLYLHAVDYLEYQRMTLADQMTMCVLIANAWRGMRMVETE